MIELILILVVFVLCIVVVLFILRLFGIYDGPNLNLR